MVEGKDFVLANPRSTNYFADDLELDVTFKNVLAGATGGQETQKFFSHADVYARMLAELGNSDGLKGWNTAPLENGATGYYKNKSDGKNEYTVVIQPKGIKIDDQGKVLPNDEKVTLPDGSVFNGIGYVSAAMILNDKTINEVLYTIARDAGNVAATLAWQAVKPVIQTMIDNMAQRSALSIGKLVKGPGGGLMIDEFALLEEQAAAEALTQKTGIRTILKNIKRPGLIAVLIIITAVFIILSLILHTSYHRIRWWNITSYKLIWTVYFYEGKFQSGPVELDKGAVKSYRPFASACSSVPFPGAKAVKQAHYADINIFSDSNIYGIGWATEVKLVEPSNDADVKYTCAIMFDIPFVGKNSTSITFDAISSLSAWYEGQEGVNTVLAHSKSSNDGQITVQTSYDFLEGKHAVPTTGDATTEAYFYQSVIAFTEKGIGQKVLPKCLSPSDS